MSRTYLDEMRADARIHAAKNFAKHVLVREGDGRWLFWDPENPCFFWFRVLTTKRHLIMVGDTGDLILNPHGADALAWLRGVLQFEQYDLCYVAEKASRDTKIAEFQKELVKRYLDELESEARCYREEQGHPSQALEEMVEEGREIDWCSAGEFYSWCSEHAVDEYPEVEGLTWGFMHRIEGLRHFCLALNRLEAEEAESLKRQESLLAVAAERAKMGA